MNTEIERKFLVKNERWRSRVGAGLMCEQGYIVSNQNDVAVRVRRLGEKGFLTLKGPTEGFSRAELEYEIPVEEAEYMLRHFCGESRISKTRYCLDEGGDRWEIDEFSGKNTGLLLAEIELKDESQEFTRPDWLGVEVSQDARYFNSALAQNPFPFSSGLSGR